MTGLIWYVNIKLVADTMTDSVGKFLGSGNQYKLPENFHPYLRSNVTLNKYEIEVASDVILPSNIDVDYNMIGGSEVTKLSLWECIYDLATYSKYLEQNRTGFSQVMAPIKGVLLYGPPGCGKTMLVRATSKQSNIPILSVSPSLVLRKYYGESQQIVKAIFTLAEKMHPCIIFIDEIDALFRTRGEGEHSTDRSIKTEFMQLWDSIDDRKNSILVIGSTNMPQS